MSKTIRILSWAYLAIYMALLLLMASMEFFTEINYAHLGRVIGLVLIPPFALILYLKKQPVPLSAILFGILLIISALSEAHMFSQFVMVSLYLWLGPMLLFLAYIGGQRATNKT
ncbi:hypothetical protein ACFOEK_20795 [Litoribrevibacter euphylliae]|uniref:DUF2069 domain-containing protein n=1 Tax=Litoribrevibacter euphylliae TaxID=1834034 RepID=A0ABV7HM00_9GAMM